MSRLRKIDIKQLFITLKKDITELKEDIKVIKNVKIPENIKIRIKKLEVDIMGVEEQIVSLEDRMRVIELAIERIDTDITTSKSYVDSQIVIINDKLITAKKNFNTALQDLDDRKADKIIPEP